MPVIGAFLKTLILNDYNVCTVQARRSDEGGFVPPRHANTHF